MTLAESFVEQGATVTVVKKGGVSYQDGFVPRFRQYLKTHGFVFSKPTSPEILSKVNTNAAYLSDDDWKSLPYPFLPKERAALIKMQSGAEDFTPSDVEELEFICGDFFDLNGAPRNTPQIASDKIAALKP